MLPSRRRFLTLSGAWALALTWPAHARETLRLGGAAFGSYWRISLAAQADIDSVRQRIDAIITSVDAGMSPYRAQSEITQFNTLRSRDWMPVSEPTRTVVDAALRMANYSDGAFDPTVGPIVGRYGFGPITGTRRGTYQQLALRPDAIRKDDIGLSLDLCGIAKGYALDRMTAAFDALGLDDYLIELGGEVFARGRHPSGRVWQVAIERPISGTTALEHLVALDNRKAIATSGDTINGYEVAGHRYSHIINPHTAAPVSDAIASVSVLADTAMKADGLATALMAMGLEDGAAFAQDRAVDAFILARDGGRYKIITTGRFADHLLT